MFRIFNDDVYCIPHKHLNTTKTIFWLIFCRFVIYYELDRREEDDTNCFWDIFVKTAVIKATLNGVKSVLSSHSTSRASFLTKNNDSENTSANKLRQQLFN